MSGAAMPGQMLEVVPDSSFGHAVQRHSPHVPALAHGDPSGFVESVAAEGARQHRHMVQIPAFVVGADRALFHVRGHQEPDRVFMSAKRASGQFAVPGQQVPQLRLFLADLDAGEAVQDSKRRINVRWHARRRGERDGGRVMRELRTGQHCRAQSPRTRCDAPAHRR